MGGGVSVAVRRYRERLQKRLEVLNAGQQRPGCQSEGKGRMYPMFSILFPRPVRRLHPLSDFTGGWIVFLTVVDVKVGSKAIG